MEPISPEYGGGVMLVGAIEIKAASVALSMLVNESATDPAVRARSNQAVAYSQLLSVMGAELEAPLAAEHLPAVSQNNHESCITLNDPEALELVRIGLIALAETTVEPHASDFLLQSTVASMIQDLPPLEETDPGQTPDTPQP